ncbi:glycoside hydrolase family 104 protein [Synechococcus sp. LTW-R]|uniref:glycoside hydrolase family 24 protein n=1 Tax=Synechococcus sp. LTW-R TaxID=2751170 RepID=UPI001628C1D5|nr:glycoside hydrolase family 104 protein [Synechococcus sp. LTW-R]QNG30078.1 glycoside hydrolase family 104 protein [Synechococcus sp. LTW-R]
MPIRHSLQRSLKPSRAAAPACSLGLLLLAAGPLVAPSMGSEVDQSIEHVVTAASQSDSGELYAITPHRRALLNTIRYAEGTWKQGHEGYRTLYGGGRFSSLAKHPDVVVVKRYASAAAGAYQFLPGTWREAATKLSLRSFKPHNQDQAALYLIDRRGVLDQVDRKGLTREVMAVLSKEWASFPSHNGLSAYGQPVKKATELANFYANNLKQLKRSRWAQA